MNNIPRHLFFFCLLFVTVQLIAQPTNCIGFSDLEVGTVYNQENGSTPGDVIYETGNANVAIGSFTTLNGAVEFDQIAVIEGWNNLLQPPSLFINYSTATFQYNEVVNTLCFTGFLSGHEINFGLNGQVGIFTNLLDPNLQEEWPDYNITTSSTTGTTGELVTMCINGPIEEFTIGGIEFLLDDVCTETFVSCTFDEPNLQAFCQNDEAISLSIDFGSVVGNNEFVDVLLDGEFYGFFPITAFPLVLENAIPQGVQDTTTVSVCINDNPDCCYTQTLELPTCVEENCITFAEVGSDTLFSANTGVQPGDVILEFPGVNLSMGTYVSLDGTINFGEIAVQQPWIANLETPSLYINFATATFSYATPVTELCFTANADTWPVNFGINGNLNVFSSLLDPVLPNAFPNHTVTVTALEPNSSGLVQVCISGIIENFTVGGIEFLLDDVCTYAPICNISNLQVGQFNCEDNSQPYLFFLDFDHNQQPLDSFNLRVGGDFYGRFAYGDLPLSELEIEVAPGTALHFLVRDTDTEACAEDLTIETYNCESACTDFAAELVSIECLNNITLQAVVAISSPIAGQYVTLEGLSNGTIYGGPQNGPDYAFFEISGELDPEGYILADSLTGCSTVLSPFDFDPNQCQACDLFDVIVTPTDCNPNNVYSVTIDLQSTNPIEPLLVILNSNQTFGPFLPAEFPVTVGTLIGSIDEPATVEIISVNDQCAYFTEFLQNCLDCEDFQVAVFNIECTSNESIAVQFDIGGVVIGEPLRITSSADPNFVQELTFAGNPVTVFLPLPNTPSFSILVEAQGIDCEVEINNLEVPPGCGSSCANFFAELSGLDCFPTDSLYVAFQLGGIEAGEPLRITTANSFVTELIYDPNGNIELVLPINGQNVLTLIIEAQAAGCETTLTIEVPEDCQDSCSNFSADIQLIECYEDSPYVELVIFLAGIEANGQTILVQNVNSGTFLSVDLTANPLVIPWPTADEGLLQITELGNGCVTQVGFEPPANCNDDCEGIFEVLEVTCTEGNPLFVFTAQGPEGLPFFVRAGGVEYPFTYGQEAYELIIDGVPNALNYELRFRDQQAGCVREVLVDNPCFCFIEVLLAEATECNGDGQFFINLAFTGATSWGGGQFLVEAGGYGELFDEGTNDFTFGPFASGTVDILITEIVSGDCMEIVTVQQECDPIECETSDLVIEGTACDPDGNYSLEVDFNANVDGPFIVFNEATGESQTVTLEQLPVQFGPYNINEIQTSLIIVYLEATNGCTIEDIYVQECEPNGECGFNDIFAEAYACDGDQFLVDVAFNNPNGGPLGFYIFGDGMIFGPFAYGEPFYTFGPLNGSEPEHDILILDIANPACFGNYEFNYSCTDECNIQEVVATPTECDGEFFGVELNVIGTNLGETFTVVGNGNNYGTFSYADLPILLGPFAGDAETSYEFGVIDLQNPGCTNFTEIEPVNCLPCDIRDLVYEVDCGNETYTLTLDFIYENPASDGFRLQIGGETVESFPYSALPLTITLPYSTIGNTLRVEDFLEEACGQTTDFEVPCCSLGNILNELTVDDCEDNGEYSFTVGNFNGGNLSDSLVINYAPAGSTIIATEVVAYSSLPVTIGPLTGNGTTSYIVVLNDQENQCAVTTTIEPVFCDNDACVEFEGVEGVFAPAFGFDSGDEITVENEVIVTYERNPSTNCACNLFVTDGIPGVNFGSGHIVATQNSGFGLNFTEVTTAFNTVNVDYYFQEGEFGIAVNGEAAVIVSNINDLPLSIATGVELQATISPNNPASGMLTFSGENIESILLFTDGNGGFDNVCLSLDDNVWPGDTNSDNIASHIDLLSIGLTFGNTGPSRNNMTSEWTGLISQNWGDDFADGTNHKHADANGDGVVNLEDLAVLAMNYGLEHGPVTEFEALPFTDLDPPIFIDLDETDQLPAGTAVEIPIVAGSADLAIQNIYGLAFTLELDPDIFNMSSLEIIYPTSWFGEPGTNTATIHEVYGDGRVEVALTRTDHNNVSGFGPIMYLRIIIDDIAGVEVPTELVLDKVMGINHEEQPLVLRPGASMAMVTATRENGFDRDALLSSFGIFPNPTADWINFHNQYSMAPNRVDLFNVAGQHLKTFQAPGMKMDLRSLPAGVYLMQIHLEGHIFTERVIKLD